MLTSIHGIIASSKGGASSWAQVGNTLTVTGAGAGAVAALSSSRVAFVDINNDELRTLDWDGTDWSQTGNALSIPDDGTGFFIIASLSATRVAVVAANLHSLTTYDFDGTDWSQTGNATTAISPFGVGKAAMANLNSTDVAIRIGPTVNEVQTWRFDGTDWAEVGTGLAITTGVYASGTALNSTDFIAVDDTGEELANYRWNGSSWSTFGNAFDLGVMVSEFPNIASMTSSRIAYFDQDNDELRAYDFDGTDWTLAANPLSLPANGNSGLAGLDTDLICFVEQNKVSTYQYS